MRKIPSCELLDQLDEVDGDKGILLYKLDDYGNKLFKQLESLNLAEEDRVTIAEAYSEVDEHQTGQLPMTSLDALFRACLRELPGYELRKITDNEKSDHLTLVQFANIFTKQKSSDFANTFKSSIKEATGVINKKNNAVEVEKAETQSYNASHSYSLAERRAFSTWINQNLATDKDCKGNVFLFLTSQIPHPFH